MAEQESPVRRKVALKIIKLGMDTKQVVARFEAERQALALMDHPNIARIFDAGVTGSPLPVERGEGLSEGSAALSTYHGRPYFVMELVGGIKITDYCDQNHLTTRQRLDLFIEVCRAIQHAHQKGIIHRDIKPSNVLVATQDGVPVPKVIDFGIAKATQGRLTDQTVFTAFEQFLGTPAYMSPEQAQLGGLDVDTRSDIYSLGVLLYELLTGKTPFDTHDMLAGGLDEIRRTIREKEPARPSTRLSTMAAGELKAAAERRTSDAARLIHVVRGDLDWIVMKCLEKERARRYETASSLASDVQRHLNNEPVRARPPSKLYEFQKTVRRHKFGFAATAAVIAALSCGIVATSLQAIRARRAEREQGRLLYEAQAARLEATKKQMDATKNLWASYLSQARALRLSGQAGRHFESLGALRKAAAIQPSLALRNEAVASMILPDIHWLEKKDFSKAREVVSLEPTLQKYATREQTGVVSIRSVADDSILRRLPEVGVAAAGVHEFSADGRFLPVSYVDQHWRVWDWAKEAVAAEGVGFLGSAFTSDSRIIGVSDATNIVLHDLISGKKIKGISLNGATSTRAPGWFRFDPTGQRIALYTTEAGTNVLILNIQTGEILKTLQHIDHVYAVAWHPDGKHLATGCGDQTIHIWDSISGERMRIWYTESSVSLGFNHRGDVLASCGYDGYTRLWEFGSGRELSSNYKGGHILHFSLDDLKLATGLWESTGLDFFEVAYGEGLRTLYETSVSGGWVCSPVTDESGKLLAFRTRDGIELWDLQTAGRISLLNLEKEKSLVGFDAECQNLILTGQEGLFRCPIAGSRERRGIVSRPILMSTECADPVAGRMGWISENGRICAIVGNNRCQLFRTDTFEKQAESGIQPGMRFSDINWDGSLFASGAWHNPGVKVWNTQTGTLVKELPTDDESATVAFSPDRRHLMTATTYEYCFWEVGSWSLVRRIPQDPDSNFFPMMAFTADGRILAGTFARNKVRLYNVATGEILADLEAPNAKQITGLAFGQDGTQLFIAEAADAVRVWDLRLIRQQLARLGLDWDQPAFPPAEPAKEVQRERADSR